jgi:hypothetical protein
MRKISFITFLFSCIFSITCLNAQEICLSNAWRVYNHKDYDSTLYYASECIANFSDRASEIQLEWLESNENTCPPVGAVNDIMKNRIFNNSLLNDVATAYWLKAKAAVSIYNSNEELTSQYIEIARNACTEVQIYHCGRCWDKRGWFWSPAEDCRNILDRLSE